MLPLNRYGRWASSTFKDLHSQRKLLLNFSFSTTTTTTTTTSSTEDCDELKPSRPRPPPIRVSLTESAGRGVFATRRIGAGDLIHTAKPIASHPSLSDIDGVCYFCLRKIGTVTIFQAQGVRFCSQECRDQAKVFYEVETKADWSTYNEYCRTRGLKYPLLVKRLACMVISGVASADSLDILQPARLSPQMILEMEEEYNLLRSAYTKANINNNLMAFLTKQWYTNALARIRINAFRIELAGGYYEDLFKLAAASVEAEVAVGNAVYMLPSFYNHDCDPNSHIVWIDSTDARMKALCDIEPVLIEKILRAAPDVGKIYVLIKAKNKETAVQRMKNEIINTELFKGLQQRYGKSYQDFMLSKLFPVVGNVCESNLGLDEDLADVIAKEVDVIVNSAANTTFDERYDVAIDINTRGPCRLMSFARKCKKLKLFLQVSTAYVNGQRQGRIMEKPFTIGDSIAREILDPQISPMSVLPMLDVEHEIKLALDSKEASENAAVVVQKMKQLGLERAKKYGWQDTYVFTKAMGEMLIENMRGDIPVVIIRPSVIESTFKEPFPGWMEGNRMMDPIILYYGKGQLTGFLVNPNGVLDVVPVDMVVNATLAAMARHGIIRKPEINIYQIASSVINPLVFQDLAALLYEHYKSVPCMDSKGRPIHVPVMKLFNSMDDFSAQLWKDAIGRSGLAAALDSSNGNLSKKLEIICRKSVEQAKYLANIYEPYTFYGGRFDNSNTQRLMEIMSEEEKREFGFDVGSIDWTDYITKVHIPGLRRHVMKGRGMSCNI